MKWEWWERKVTRSGPSTPTRYFLVLIECQYQSDLSAFVKKNIVCKCLGLDMAIDTEKYIIIFAFQELNTINNLFMLMSGLNSVCYVSRKGVNINKKTQEITFLFRVRFSIQQRLKLKSIQVLDSRLRERCVIEKKPTFRARFEAYNWPKIIFILYRKIKNKSHKLAINTISSSWGLFMGTPFL